MAHNKAQMAVMIIFVEYESTVYMVFVTKVFVKVTLSFLLCMYMKNYYTLLVR